MAKTRYSALEKLNLLLGVYGRTFVAIFRPSWWAPFFIYALFQLAGLAGLIWYYAPGWSNVIYPLLRLFLPENAFHFPQYYLVLPTIFSAFDSFILGPTVWLIMLATAVFRLGGIYDGKKPSLGDGIRISFSSYGKLIIIWLIETVLVLAILYLPFWLLRRNLIGSPNRIMGVNLVLQLAAYIVSAALIYTIPGIILRRKKLVTALKDSISLFAQNPIMTYLIIFIPSIIRIVLNLLLGDLAPKIVTLFNPDLIPFLIFLEIILGIFINLFIYSAAVFIYRELSTTE